MEVRQRVEVTREWRDEGVEVTREWRYEGVEGRGSGGTRSIRLFVAAPCRLQAALHNTLHTTPCTLDLHQAPYSLALAHVRLDILYESNILALVFSLALAHVRLDPPLP